MSKALKTDKLNSRPVVRTLVAVSLSISLAAFGCTTDRTLGNGDPVVTPGVRTSPTGNTSTGSETTPSVPGPMFSSSIDNGQALPAVRPRASRADQAAAVIAGQAPRVRYLGVTMPSMSGRVYHSDGLVTGAFQNPALRTNPQATVNSSISSAPTPVIASGAGEGVSSGDAAAAAVLSGTSFASTTGASVIGTGVTTGTTAASTATGTGVNLGGNVNGGAAPIFASGTAASPTAATTLPLGTLASTITPTTSPTAFSALNPPTAISNFPALAANSTVTQSALAANGVAPATNGTVFTGTDNTATANTTTAAATSGATTATATATDAATSARARSGLNATARATTPARGTGTTAVTSSTTATGNGTAGRTVTNPVRVTRDANGRVTITNVNAQRNQ